MRYVVSYDFYFRKFEFYSDAEDFCASRGIPIFAIRRV